MECPNCGKQLNVDTEICDNCDFDFNSTLTCPYKISQRCIFDQCLCKKIGLQYEDCQTYLHKSGIAK